MSSHQHTAAPAGAVDPVCGMTVDSAHAAGQFEHHGDTYYFCGKGCLEKFRQDPERYLRREQPVHVTAGGKTEWTCPMHPEIVRDAPGSCPICGMALEPRTVTLDERNPEL